MRIKKSDLIEYNRETFSMYYDDFCDTYIEGLINTVRNIENNPEHKEEFKNKLKELILSYNALLVEKPKDTKAREKNELLARVMDLFLMGSRNAIVTPIKPALLSTGLSVYRLLPFFSLIDIEELSKTSN